MSSGGFGVVAPGGVFASSSPATPGTPSSRYGTRGRRRHANRADPLLDGPAHRRDRSLRRHLHIGHLTPDHESHRDQASIVDSAAVGAALTMTDLFCGAGGSGLGAAAAGDQLVVAAKRWPRAIDSAVTVSRTVCLDGIHPDPRRLLVSRQCPPVSQKRQDTPPVAEPPTLPRAGIAPAARRRNFHRAGPCPGGPCPTAGSRGGTGAG
jgi:hypothetical protein